MITEIRISCAKTINLGNFNSIRIEAGVTAAVPEGESIETVKRAAQEEIRATLEDTYRAHRKNHHNE